jgi:hypothetical protein
MFRAAVVKRDKDQIKLSAPDERYVVAQKYLWVQPNRTGDKAACSQRSPTE